jgi:hypothetical protein
MVCALPCRLRFRLVVRIETWWRFSGLAQSSSCRPVWQGVSTDSLKFRPALPFYALRVGHHQNGFMVVSGVAHLQDGWPAAVFHPLDTPCRTGLVATKRWCLVSFLFSFSFKFALQFTIESLEDKQIGLFRACVKFHYKGFIDFFVFRLLH